MENNIHALIKDSFPELEIQEGHLQVSPEQLAKLMDFLKENGFAYLHDVTAVDWPQHFTVVYQVRSYEKPDKLTVKVNVAKDKPVVPSMTGLWDSADWLEREVYDMFGIEFTGHPNLKRILLDESFMGYPLRKDFVG
jgi:NADH-quinone oxidoreductase subunit C